MVDTDSSDDGLPTPVRVTVKERKQMDVVEVDGVSWILRMRPNNLYRFDRTIFHAGYPIGVGKKLHPRIHILHGKKESVLDSNVGFVTHNTQVKNFYVKQCPINDGVWDDVGASRDHKAFSKSLWAM